ncbi:MAG: hypothetical protein HZA59_13075 [Hydrogenophilales bacterium]|nr:hypothetical protein [Hydrogenophilales bacterium]
MAKAALLVSRASALFGAMLLLGCAHPARELPPDMSNLAPSQRLLPGDTTRHEYAISCTELNAELAKTRDAISHIEAQVRGAQAENQSKGVAGILLFTPIMLSMEDNEPMKNRYRELDEHRERLLRIAQARQCPT